MIVGQAIYPALGVEEAAIQLDQAIERKCQLLFTSLHLPEADPNYIHRTRTLLEKAAAHGIKVCADISPATFTQFRVEPGDYSIFAAMHISSLRLDYGIPLEDMVRLQTDEVFELAVNASTLTQAKLEEMKQAGLDLSQMTAVHNFYPRPETGLSLAFFQSQNRLLQAYGVRVGAFIPSQNRPRAPIHAGLPTIEAHRSLPLSHVMADLLADGLTDFVYFGDPAPSEAEWETAMSFVDHLMPIRVTWTENLPANVKPILTMTHTSPPDPAELVVRSRSSRVKVQQNGLQLAPYQTVERPRGTITIDNERYLRYKGELQIARRDLPADERVNVYGRVIEQDWPLLDRIQPGMKFRLIST